MPWKDWYDFQETRDLNSRTEKGVREPAADG
jgi:hypothetical protein